METKDDLPEYTVPRNSNALVPVKHEPLDKTKQAAFDQLMAGTRRPTDNEMFVPPTPLTDEAWNSVDRTMREDVNPLSS
ncbi:MAG: hypothetical protein AB1704_20445 [Pseudomonadota bacterium]